MGIMVFFQSPKVGDWGNFFSVFGFLQTLVEIVMEILVFFDFLELDKD